MGGAEGLSVPAREEPGTSERKVAGRPVGDCGEDLRQAFWEEESRNLPRWCGEETVTFPWLRSLTSQLSRWNRVWVKWRGPAPDKPGGLESSRSGLQGLRPAWTV